MKDAARVAWDIDGTICLNPGPFPDWEDPKAVAHTGESIYSYMPLFRAANYLNPEMLQVNRSMINCIITGRPDNTLDPTIEELKRHGVSVHRNDIYMFPDDMQWTHRRNRLSKAIWIQDEHVSHYVDKTAKTPTKAIPFVCVISQG